ncbi:hypothetical protein ACFSTD_08975 [Novosphingobium colocasiae]
MKSFHFAAALAAVLPAPAFACASCGCTFTSDWLSQGLVTQPGQAVTIRYDYIPQTDLRTGTGKVDAADLDLPNEREIERSTYNHIATLAYDRQFANDFGFNLAVPWISRPHRTIAEDTVAVTRSTGAGIGDVRLVGRWQGLSTPNGITGLQLGVVLPTGSTKKRFASGPEAGEEIDRGGCSPARERFRRSSVLITTARSRRRWRWCFRGRCSLRCTAMTGSGPARWAKHRRHCAIWDGRR